MDTEIRVTPFVRTDSGNAELFAALYKDRVRYDYLQKRWLTWRQHWYSSDIDEEVFRLAKSAARFRTRSAINLPDEERTAHVKWAVESESLRRLKAAIRLAQTDSLLKDSEPWDADPWLFAVRNGVIDLRTGELRDGRQSDRITIHSNLVFNPAAECPRWTRFIEEIFDGDQDLIRFVHRAVGYSLSAETSEQCLFLCYGEGANGKSTFMQALAFAMGGYAYNLPFSAFELMGRYSIPNDVAALAGRRFVTASETNDNVRLNEARIKALTGSDTVTARLLHKEFFEFHPVAKFWLAFNHKPNVQDDSHGFWRRVRMIPFVHRFEENERDKKLMNALRAEAPGILAWIIRGCLAWQAQELGTASAVAEATDKYREESYGLSEFLDDECVVDPSARGTVAEIWAAYEQWTGREDRPQTLDRTKFSRRMQMRFKKERYGHGRDWYWVGVCLKSDPANLDFTAQADTRTDADVNSEVSLIGDSYDAT